MIFPDENLGRISLGYAYSFDRIHWRKAAFNPVFRAGEGAFSRHCYAPWVVPKGDGSFLVYRTGFDNHHHRTYGSLLRAEVLDWCDLMAPDRWGQGMMPRPLTRVGRGGPEARDGLLPQPHLGDEWFNEQIGNGGRWEKFDGLVWKRT